MRENNDLKGLDGWLVLVAIMLSFSAYKLVFKLIGFVSELILDELPIIFTSVEGVTRHFLVVSRLVFYAAALSWFLYLIILFSTFNYKFPKYLVLTLSLAVLLDPFKALVQYFLVPHTAIAYPELLIGFGFSLLMAVLWIPYMLKSERVKQTFVEKRPVQ